MTTKLDLRAQGKIFECKRDGPDPGILTVHEDGAVETVGYWEVSELVYVLGHALAEKANMFAALDKHYQAEKERSTSKSEVIEALVKRERELTRELGIVKREKVEGFGSRECKVRSQADYIRELQAKIDELGRDLETTHEACSTLAFRLELEQHNCSLAINLLEMLVKLIPTEVLK